jgi:hypothetical protein
MEGGTSESLRVLVADGPGEHLQAVTRTVAALGHEVIARESSLPEVSRLTATERPVSDLGRLAPCSVCRQEGWKE